MESIQKLFGFLVNDAVCLINWAASDRDFYIAEFNLIMLQIGSWFDKALQQNTRESTNS